MKSKYTAIEIIRSVFVLCLFAGLSVAFIWWIIIWMIYFFKNVNSSVVAALVAGLFSVAAVVGAKIWEAKYKVKHELRLRKSEVYEEFMIFMINDVLLSGRAGDPDLEDDINEFFNNYQGKLMIWGGEKVIKKFVGWRTIGNSPNLSPDKYEGVVTMFGLIEDIFTAIRKDLGHSNKGLKKLDLLRLIVKNLDADLMNMKLKSVVEV